MDVVLKVGVTVAEQKRTVAVVVGTKTLKFLQFNVFI